MDYAGQKWPIIDPKTGKETPAEVFAAVLGASGLTYAEATDSQKEEEWVISNERALWYFGGATAAIVPDYVPGNIIRHLLWGRALS